MKEETWKPISEADRHAATELVHDFKKRVAVKSWDEKRVRKLDAAFYARTQCQPGESIRYQMENER